MVGGALGIAFVIAKLGVAFVATTGVVTGVRYFITYEWNPKGKKGQSRSYGRNEDDGDTFDNIRSQFRGRN